MNAEKSHLNKDFYSYLLYNSYLFDKETIENYLLSLKVKPFVILTGNSGTGKTKLSQLFAKYLLIEDIGIEDNFIFTGNDYNENHDEDYSNLDSLDEYLTLNVKLNQFTPDFRGIFLPEDSFREYLPIKFFDGEHQILVEEIPAKAWIDLNPGS